MIGQLSQSSIVALLIGVSIWWGGTNFSFFELAVLVVGALSAYWLIGQRGFKSFFSTIGLPQYWLLAFTLLVSLQFWFSSNNVDSFAFVTLYLVGVYFLVKWWQRENPESFLRDLTTYYLGAAVFISLLGFGRYVLTALPLTWNLVPYEVRWRGFLDDPVVYGALLVPAILVFAYLAIYTPSRRYFLLYCGAALFCFSNLILSGSRGAWLNLVIAGFVLVCLEPKLFTGQRLFRVMIGISVALITALTLLYIVPLEGRTYREATLNNRFNASDIPRIHNVEEAPTLILNRPIGGILIGTGSGSYELFSENNFSAHNTYLRLLFEQGILGLILLPAFWYLTVRAGWQNPDRDRRVVVLLTALIAGMMVQSLFVDTLHWRHLWLLLALI